MKEGKGKREKARLGLGKEVENICMSIEVLSVRLADWPTVWLFTLYVCA